MESSFFIHRVIIQLQTIGSLGTNKGQLASGSHSQAVSHIGSGTLPRSVWKGRKMQVSADCMSVYIITKILWESVKIKAIAQIQFIMYFLTL